MKRLPKVLTAVTLGGCSAPMLQSDAGLDAGYDAGTSDAGISDAGISDAGTSDAGTSDAGTSDAGTSDAGRVGTPWGDAGCVLPSDFPWDSGFAFLADDACVCTWLAAVHCFVEGGPRCFSWACPPAKASDGGYRYQPDGGILCLC